VQAARNRLSELFLSRRAAGRHAHHAVSDRQGADGGRP
jgi:hypothetical protein